MELPRKYYKLPDLAKKWNKTEEDLLQMAAAGALELSVRCSGTVTTKRINQESPWLFETDEIDGYVQLYNDDCESIVEFGCKVCGCIRSVKWNGEPVSLSYHGPQPLRGLPVCNLFIKDSSRLLILPAEVARVEALYLTVAVPEQATPQPDKAARPIQIEEDELISGETKLCAAFDLKPTSFTAVKRRVTNADMEFRRKIPGEPNSTPQLYQSEINKIIYLWKKKKVIEK